MLKRPPYANKSVPLGKFSSFNSVDTYSDGIASLESGVFSSVKTPNFRLLKAWQRPNNPFSYSYSYEKRGTGRVGEKQFGHTWNGWTGLIQDNIAGAGFTLPSFTNTTDLKARNKLLSNLKSQTVNLGLAFAERKQTVNLVAKNVNRLALAALLIRRGRLVQARDLFSSVPHSAIRPYSKDVKPSSKNLANHWLEFAYGWRPLINDIYGSCELIANTYHRRKPTSIRSTSTRQESIKNHIMFVHTSWADSIEYLSGSYLERSTYVVFYQENSAFAARMSQTGLANPLALAWELIPYSFVVDWLVNVGGYLNNLDATLGLDFQSGTKTLQSSLRGSTKWVTTKSKGNGGECYTNGRQFIRDNKNRTVLTSFPSPGVEVNLNLGVSRVLSGIALLTQAFKR